MNQIATKGIVLSRTNFGEADRIVTFITPDHGKIRLIAKGVRKIKSKLAGGIELFSVSDLTYIEGRNDIGTLISSRLINHYGNIVNDIDRVQMGYNLVKLMASATEDEPETEYFNLLQDAFIALDDKQIPLGTIELWFQAQLLRLGGHTPNLRTTIDGKPLKEDESYDFDYTDVAFIMRPSGHFAADHIKTLRLLFSNNNPHAIAQVQGTADLLPNLKTLLQILINSYIVRK